MGGMMAGTGPVYAWVMLLILVGVAMAVTLGIVGMRVLRGRHDGDAQLFQGSEARRLDDAQAVLRLRYARGDISREVYLQGKVELED